MTTAIQFVNDKPTPATSSSAQGCTMSRAARPTTCPKEYVAGVSVTLTVWCSSHWSRSGPSSKPHTGCSRASQERRNGKASQVQELEPPPTPNCHGCVRRQSVMKCMTSRCAAWFIKDDMVWKPVNKWGNLRRIPFKAEHSNTKCFSSPTPCIHSRHSRSDRGIPARRPVTDGRV